MAKSRIINNAARLIRGAPLGVEERIEELEKNVNLKFSQLEDTVATLNQIIQNLSEENVALKQENLSLKQSLFEKAGSLPNTILDGIKERIIKPIREETDEFVELIFNEDKEEPEISNPPGPKIAMKNNANFKMAGQSGDILQLPLQSPFPADLEQPELKPELDVEKAPASKKENTIKWMRQKFGLSANIRERKLKAVKSKRFKR